MQALLSTFLGFRLQVYILEYAELAENVSLQCCVRPKLPLRIRTLHRSSFLVFTVAKTTSRGKRNRIVSLPVADIVHLTSSIFKIASFGY
jgi:hypothetical protein